VQQVSQAQPGTHQGGYAGEMTTNIVGGCIGLCTVFLVA
jgi:hypothetical protein